MGLFSRKPAPPAVPPGERVYAIGDVHGRLDLLDRLLDAIGRDHRARGPARATVILLGDLIDRGPDSAGVVRRCMAGLDWAQVDVLRGNHEAMMLAGADGDVRTLVAWLRNGGDATLASWGAGDRIYDAIEDPALLATLIPADALAWLRACPASLRIGDYFFAHAGVRPGVPLDRQEETDLVWIRREFLSSDRDHGAFVVHGHTIGREIEERSNRLNLDTGAYASGHLSAVGLDGGDRWFLQT